MAIGASLESAPVDVLAIEVGGQRFGISSASVKELLRMVEITPLPRAPAIVEGIINVRGKVVPVLDIRSRFRLPSRQPDPADHLVVASAGARLVALRVDRAIELIPLDAADVEEAKGLVPGVEYVSWVAKTATNLVLIHDLTTFLSQAEAETLDHAMSVAESR